MKISLRKATDSDVEFLIKLRDITMKTYLEAVGALTTESEYLKRVHYHFNDAKIIESNGKRVGLFKASYIKEKSHWYLVQIQVHPDFQGLKIGSQLIHQLLDKASNQGASVGLGVLKSNPAKKLYIRLGFEQVGETEFEYDMMLKPK